MKVRNKITMVHCESGRGDRTGDGSMVRVRYFYALLTEKDSFTLKSWGNIPHVAWEEQGFQARVLQLLEEFQKSGQEMALIAFTHAATHAESLKLLPLEGMNRASFFKRHPRPTLKVISTFAPRAEGVPPSDPRVYVGSTPGGEGFCQDERRVSKA